MGTLSSTWDMGISRMTSIIESIPIRNNSDSPYGIFGETSSQKRARTMAESTRSAVLPCPAPSVATHPDPTTDFAFSQNRQCIAGPTEFRWRIRMRPSSNSATGASLASTTTLRPFEVLDLAYIQLGLRNRSQHAQIIEPVGRDFM